MASSTTPPTITPPLRGSANEGVPRMSKLLERLKDAARSGVYRTSADLALREAVAGSGALVARVALDGSPTKAALRERIAAGLSFPPPLGRNWDALEDSLRDLSWLEGSPRVLVFERAASAAELAVLVEVLGDAAT